MDTLVRGVLNILGEYDERITIRHLFYRCANAGLIEKSENAYNSLRGHLVKWRREKIIPYSAFIDSTRWHYGMDTFDNLDEYLHHAAASYRLNLWAHADYFPEVWVEKDAIASMVSRIASEWNLRVFVSRGDCSISALYDAAMTFKAHRAQGKTPVILYLGDHDERGVDIPRKIERNLKKDFNCDVALVRVAVNEDHIHTYNLPTRPPKNPGEVKFAVEIDALPPAHLRALLVKQIEGLIDPDQLLRMKDIESGEQETIRQTAINRKTN
jgi:hypothetical protein